MINALLAAGVLSFPYLRAGVLADSVSVPADDKEPVSGDFRKSIMWGTVGMEGSVLDKCKAIKAAGYDGIEPNSHMDRDEVLAAMPEDEAEMILTHNEQEIRFVLKTDFSALRGFLIEARRKGYASAQGMLLEGTIGVSHVLRMGNEVVGSIAIDAVRSEQWDRDQPKIIQELQNALP